MEPYKENLITHSQYFPVDVFIQDNLKSHVVANLHWHDCFEILYMLEGSARLQINENHFLVEKHDLIILNEGDIHSAYCVKGEDVRILVIKFMPEIIERSSAVLFESKYIIPFLRYRNGKIFHLGDQKMHSSLKNLMMGIYEEFEKKDTGYEIYIKGYIFQMIADLTRKGIISVYNPDIKENDIIIKIDTLLKYIESNYNTKIDLKTAAKMMNFSSSYFSRYFKSITGRTFKEYINFVKVSEAEKLIISTDMNISQAAYEAGFSNVSSFNRVFKNIRGYSPGNLKKSKTAKN